MRDVRERDLARVEVLEGDVHLLRVRVRVRRRGRVEARVRVRVRARVRARVGKVAPAFLSDERKMSSLASRMPGLSALKAKLLREMNWS